MSGYYWETFIDDKALRECLRAGCELVGCIDEPDNGSIARMQQSYPTYVQRRYKVFQHGFCVGYTTEEIVQRLKLKPD